MFEKLWNLFWVLLTHSLAIMAGWILNDCRNRYRIYVMRKRLDLLSRERGKAEAVLIVANREDIRPSVERFLEEHQKKDLPIFQIYRPELFSDNADEWQKFIEEVRQEVQRLRQHSPTRILLFTNVPVAMGICLGALLDNGPEVVVHHYFNGMYRPISRLAAEAVKL